MIPERGETNEARPMIASALCLDKISICSDMGENLDAGQLTL